MEGNLILKKVKFIKKIVKRYSWSSRPGMLWEVILLPSWGLAGFLCDLDGPWPGIGFPLPVSAVGVLPVDPAAQLGVLERRDAHRHVVVLLLALDVHPLVAGVDGDDLALPVLVWLFQTQVDPGAGGARLGVAVLVEEVPGFLGHAAEPVDQLVGSVLVEAGEVDPAPGQLPQGRTDS